MLVIVGLINDKSQDEIYRIDGYKVSEYSKLADAMQKYMELRMWQTYPHKILDNGDKKKILTIIGKFWSIVNNKKGKYAIANCISDKSELAVFSLQGLN